MTTGARKRVSFDSRYVWEIGGESELHAETDPSPPCSDKTTVARITHSNVYGPVDDVALFVRAGDLENPTAFDDLESASDWLKMDLVEENLHVDGKDIFRGDKSETFDPMDEIPVGRYFRSVVAPGAGQGQHRNQGHIRRQHGANGGYFRLVR